MHFVGFWFDMGVDGIVLVSVVFVFGRQDLMSTTSHKIEVGLLMIPQLFSSSFNFFVGVFGSMPSGEVVLSLFHDHLLLLSSWWRASMSP